MTTQAQRFVPPPRDPFEQAKQLRELARTVSALAAGLEHAADDLLEAADRVIDGEPAACERCNGSGLVRPTPQTLGFCLCAQGCALWDAALARAFEDVACEVTK